MSKARELAELGAVYDSGALSNRNILMNGAQVISQRGTSALTASASSDTFITDRFRISNYRMLHSLVNKYLTHPQILNILAKLLQL